MVASYIQEIDFRMRTDHIAHGVARHGRHISRVKEIARDQDCAHIVLCGILYHSRKGS